MVSVKILSSLFSALIIFRHVSWAATQHIRVISERSCDTEDWSNNTGNSALHHRNKWYITAYWDIKLLFYTVIIFHNVTVLLYVWWNNTVLVSRRDFLKKWQKHTQPQIFEWQCISSSLATSCVYFPFPFMIKFFYPKRLVVDEQKSFVMESHHAFNDSDINLYI